MRIDLLISYYLMNDLTFSSKKFIIKDNLRKTNLQYLKINYPAKMSQKIIRFKQLFSFPRGRNNPKKDIKGRIETTYRRHVDVLIW